MVVSSTQITASTPPIDLDQDEVVGLVITNVDGQSDSIDFTYKVLPPNVTSVSPSIVSTSGGTTVLIKGSDFVEGLTVTIDGNAINPVTFVSDKEIRVQTPAHNAANVDLQVTNPDGQSGKLTKAINYVDKPFIESVMSNAGNISGGTSITISGSNFDNDVTVKIGENSAINVTVVSPTEITVTTPAGDGGFADVVVENPASGFKATLIGGFNYLVPPEIESVIPNTSSILGGQLLNITGQHFREGATVTIDGQPATDVTFVSPTEITVITPPFPLSLFPSCPCSVDLVVTVTSILPASGPITGRTVIAITGENFVDGATVTIGGKAATDVVVVSSTQITAKTPAGSAGVVDVVVTNLASQSDTLSAGFTYIPPPTVTAISPNSGPMLGGTEVTITGENFQNGATVKIGDGNAVDVVFVSATQITAKTPQGSGKVGIVVTNPDSQSGTLADVFAYIPPPTVTAISPNSGPMPGGTEITITGENFQDGATVKIGADDAVDVVFVSATQITAKTPEGSGKCALLNYDAMQVQFLLQ